MDERDPLALGANARRLVDQAKPGRPAPVEGGIEIGDREADVVDSRTASGHELADGRGGITPKVAALQRALPKLYRAQPVIWHDEHPTTIMVDLH